MTSVKSCYRNSTFPFILVGLRQPLSVPSLSRQEKPKNGIHLRKVAFLYSLKNKRYENNRLEIVHELGWLVFDEG